MRDFICITAKDNVAVALRALSSGETITDGNITVTLLQEVPFGHKFALREIALGENIIKYGQPIGHATQTIKAGQHIQRTFLSATPDEAAFSFAH